MQTFVAGKFCYFCGGRPLLAVIISGRPVCGRCFDHLSESKGGDKE